MLQRMFHVPLCLVKGTKKRAGREGHISRLMIFTPEVKIVMAVVYGHFVVAECKDHWCV
jgi:hypothetical protein